MLCLQAEERVGPVFPSWGVLTPRVMLLAGLGTVLRVAGCGAAPWLLLSRYLQQTLPQPSLLAKSLQSCLTLCNPMDCSPPGSSVLGILQARRQEWVTISFSRGSFQLRDGTQLSHIAGGFLTSKPPGKPMLKTNHITIVLKSFKELK